MSIAAKDSVEGVVLDVQAADLAGSIRRLRRRARVLYGREAIGALAADPLVSRGLTNAVGGLSTSAFLLGHSADQEER
jgi:hypothetical protein